jgi:hypothetical protein
MGQTEGQRKAVQRWYRRHGDAPRWCARCASGVVVKPIVPSGSTQATPLCDLCRAVERVDLRREWCARILTEGVCWECRVAGRLHVVTGEDGRHLRCHACTASRLESLPTRPKRAKPKGQRWKGATKHAKRELDRVARQIDAGGGWIPVPGLAGFFTQGRSRTG